MTYPDTGFSPSRSAPPSAPPGGPVGGPAASKGELRRIPVFGLVQLALALVCTGLLFVPPTRLVGVLLVLPLGAAVLYVWFRDRGHTSGPLTVGTLAVLSVALGLGVAMVVAGRTPLTGAGNPPLLSPTPMGRSDRLHPTGPDPGALPGGPAAPWAPPAPSGGDPAGSTASHGSSGDAPRDPSGDPSAGHSQVRQNPGIRDDGRGPLWGPPRTNVPLGGGRLANNGPAGGHSPVNGGTPARNGSVPTQGAVPPSGAVSPNAGSPANGGRGQDNNRDQVPDGGHDPNGVSRTDGTDGTEGTGTDGNGAPAANGLDRDSADSGQGNRAGSDSAQRNSHHCTLGQYRINDDGTGDVCVDSDGHGHYKWRRHVPAPG